MKLLVVLILLVSAELSFSAIAQAKTEEEVGKDSDAAQLENVPRKYEKEPGITLHFEGWSEKSAGPLCRLVNLSDKSVFFSGYGIQMPWYRIQKLEGTNWVEYRVGWFCGTGLRSSELPISKSTVIDVDGPINASVYRVGVTIYDPKKVVAEKDLITVWSEKIDATNR